MLQFDGQVERLDESLEHFSPDGRPSRASLAPTLVRAQLAGYASGPGSAAASSSA